MGEESAFPHEFPLGRPSRDELLTQYASVLRQTMVWRDWAQMNPASLTHENRAAQGRSVQQVPTHLRIESLDDAAGIVGDGWPERIERNRERCHTLRALHPNFVDLVRILRLTDRYSDTDFELLLTVVDWYLADPSRPTLGVTPRQVPIPGVHAKWLQNHRVAVQELTGLEDLGLLPGHASRIHFTYLDPGHRARGGRVHDSATVGDAFEPAYRPDVVIISENKDTAIHFPPFARAISVEGVGKGGRTIASFPWIRAAQTVVYWGDIDRDGFEILNGYRADLECDIDTILMDRATYEAYEKFGTNLDQYGKPIPPGIAKSVGRLRDDERSLYLLILAPEHDGHRRIEQERIPLDRARTAVEQILRNSRPRL